MLGTPLARIATGGTLGAALGAAGALVPALPAPAAADRPAACAARGRRARRRPARPLRRSARVAPARRTTSRFALGFCHAQDRLWQLEFFRRATAGRLSEFAGADALPADRLMRTLGMRRVAEREARELVAASRRRSRPRTSPGSTPRSTRRARCPIEFQLAAPRARAVEHGRPARRRPS